MVNYILNLKKVMTLPIGLMHMYVIIIKNLMVVVAQKNLVMNTLGHLQLTLETKIHLMVVMLKSYVQILMLTIKKILKLVKN